MGRPAKFTEDDFLDAALEELAEHGTVSIAAIAGRLGAPNGSVYHRFSSRDRLLATMWIRSIRRFQHGFLAALARDPIDAALHSLRWSRENPTEARALLLYRREDLIARWPDELGPGLESLNTAVQSALATYAVTRYGPDDPDAERRVVLALVDIPRAALLRDLRAGSPPAPSLDEMVTAAATAVLG
ncbi:TetR/AcrR family transcriptional regulator [Nocardia stercoris]|uniref:TetR/AcrR family transcriptional regulator n=1 Tax=Nocardia stercoris TaxID=2483361 RepID=A0A3M2KYN9_9NOCA|nr:TetR/AcrR family transcriptional regulator [Nocardia stercoris]RMI30582.1 TetR/AcrR family transcriptional regulator [Nocardia stercoris]